jgi:hypothetical protein
MNTKIDINNPFRIQDDLFANESRSHLTCPNCKFHTVIKVFNPEDFNYPEWNAKAKFQNNNSKEHVKLRIPNAITLSKQLRIHPTRVFNELVSCYWSAWDWGVCEQIAINNLQTKCLNCSYDLEYLRIKNES